MAEDAQPNLDTISNQSQDTCLLGDLGNAVFPSVDRQDVLWSVIDLCYLVQQQNASLPGNVTYTTAATQDKPPHVNDNGSLV